MPKRVAIAFALVFLLSAAILWIASPNSSSEVEASPDPVELRLRSADALTMGDGTRVGLAEEPSQLLESPAAPSVEVLSSLGLPIVSIQVRSPGEAWHEVGLSEGRVLRKELHAGIEVGAPGHQTEFWNEESGPIVLRPAGGFSVSGLDPNWDHPIPDFSWVFGHNPDHPRDTDVSVWGWTGEDQWTIALSPVRCEHGWREHASSGEGGAAYIGVVLPLRGIIRSRLRFGGGVLGLVQLSGFGRAEALPLSFSFSQEWQSADLEMEIIPFDGSAMEWNGVWGKASFSSNWASRVSFRRHADEETRAPELPLEAEFLLMAFNPIDATWCSVTFIHTGEPVFLSPTPGLQLSGELRDAQTGKPLSGELRCNWEGLRNGKRSPDWSGGRLLEANDRGRFQLPVRPSYWMTLLYPDQVRITADCYGYANATITAPVGPGGLVNAGVFELSPLTGHIRLLPEEGIEPSLFLWQWVFWVDSDRHTTRAAVKASWKSDDGAVHLSLSPEVDWDTAQWDNMLLGVADGDPLPITRYDAQSYRVMPRDVCQLSILPIQLENARVDLDLEWRGIRTSYLNAASERFREPGHFPILVPPDGFSLYWSIDGDDLSVSGGPVDLKPGSASVQFQF